MKKIALVGCGSLGSLITKGISQQLANNYTLIGAFDTNADAVEKLSTTYGCACCTELSQLLNLKPDYVIEAATAAVLKEITPAVLTCGSDIIALSVGAFADDKFHAQAESLAREYNRKIHIPSGAIGGFDIMQSALFEGDLHSKITTVKNPASLPGRHGGEAKDAGRELLFSGKARDAIERFPKNVNVAVALAIATTGVDNTDVEVFSDPSAKYNTHKIELFGDFGHACIEIAAKASGSNPKSSAIAASSVVAKLKNLASPICFM